ncbi:MAG: hypothetical protein A2V86_16365 [Deltaproteobacteria bacterium RBG_16_49_23]|nr:MAG: hypothetical protein A2V86_16365 [Deltaproteobacteria bacterium RBG_16_49_23]
MDPKTEIENCFPGKSPSPCACLREAASAKAGEGVRERGNPKGELFTLTLTLSRQGRGNYFKISKSGFGMDRGLVGIRKFGTE